jgi:Tfp pilus assembly protein PilF
MLKRAADLADTIPKVWLELAHVYGKLGKEDDEFNALRQYNKHDPQNLEVNKRMGIMLMQKGKTTEGMVHLETANALSANDPEIIANLAEGYIRTNRKKEATDILQKAKALQKNDPDVRMKLFELYRAQGKNREAEVEIKELIQMKRDNQYLYAYADMMVSEGKHRDAEGLVEDILATDPENIEAQLLKGYILRAQKKYDEAVEVYKEISFIDPENAPALYERAETHMLMSKPQWAETFYKRALRADPNYALAELGLAKLAKLMKDESGYREHLEKARRMDPKNKQIIEEYNRRK